MLFNFACLPYTEKPGIQYYTNLFYDVRHKKPDNALGSKQIQ